MDVNLRAMGAAKAKAQFLSLLDEVETKREPVVITKNGRPVARIVPMPFMEDDPIFGFYKGKLNIVGDILSPMYTDEELDEFETRTVMQLTGGHLRGS